MIPLKDDNPTYSTPIITYFIIGICIVVFLLELSSPNYKSGAIFYSWGVIPASLIHNLQLPDEVYRVPPTITLFTSMFMHGGFMHLIGNMLYMWIFADNIEDCIENVDVTIILTEWSEFRTLSAQYLSKFMKGDIVVDFRNALNPENFINKNITLHQIGRGPFN